jgi:hypothetical protein
VLSPQTEATQGQAQVHPHIVVQENRTSQQTSQSRGGGLAASKLQGSAQSSSSNWLSQRMAEIQGEIETFLKDKELLRQLEANTHTRSSKACIMLKDQIKAKSNQVEEMIIELRDIKSMRRSQTNN